MITVAVAGSLGRMGSCVCDFVQKQEDMQLVCGIDPSADGMKLEYDAYTSLDEALEHKSFDVLVDFTAPSVVASNIEKALSKGINCVVGTTGLSLETLEKLAEGQTGEACLFYAPNFTTGAVLMMEFARMAAQYFPEAEIIEYHHCNKKDAASGTALRTAQIIASARDFQSQAPGKETELENSQGARGALVEGVPVHAVRSNGFVASQEVIFGSFGQTLSIRHDSWDRSSYMPGVMIGIRNVMKYSGLIVGLENFLESEH